jgi:hypothetical protein
VYSVFIVNGNEFGRIGNDESTKFNFTLFSSSLIKLNFYYGCDGEFYCNDTATVLLSLLNQISCKLSINSTQFNLCPLSTNDTIFNVSTPTVGNLSLSLGSSNVPSCNKTFKSWGILQNGPGVCFDVATGTPTYTLQGESIISSYSLTYILRTRQTFSWRNNNYFP